MKLVVFGANGQVGRALQRTLRRDLPAAEVVALDRATADLADPQAIVANIRKHRPDVIINAAAYTAVDRAESEADTATQINAIAPGVMAEAARECDALLVHYSTDYVFDGTKPGAYVETDATHPLSVYGSTKLEGEAAIQRVGGRYLIFRTSWVYGNDGANFMKTMLRLAAERDHLRIVNDQIGAPTSSDAIADATVHCVQQYFAAANQSALHGVYHMTCAGETSWYGFANAIFELFLTPERKSCLTVEPIPATAYPTPAQRPGNSLLSNKKLSAAFHRALPDWRTALQDIRALS